MGIVQTAEKLLNILRYRTWVVYDPDELLIIHEGKRAECKRHPATVNRRIIVIPKHPETEQE